jgi:phosphate transport system permease protein
LKKITEKLLEGLLTLSGMVSALTVLLIVFFLFREGIGLFGKSPTEEGFTIAVHQSNPVQSLTAEQVKHIFDQKITRWETVGGNTDSIILFRLDDLFNYFPEEELIGIDTSNALLAQKIDAIIARTPGILAYIPQLDMTAATQSRLIKTEDINIFSFLSGREWFPTSTPIAQFGVLPLLLGTLWVSFIAILIALPFGLATAIYMAEVANPKIRGMLKPVIELLAGIPSVVYGFFGLIVLVPMVQKLFNLPVGETGLTGSMVLAIMALPTIITVAEDALRSTPRSLKEASLALGASHWQTIYRVMIPHASSGITAAVILGIGRAVGETMAVLMVTGNAAVIPHSALEPMRTIPATIAAELGEAAKGSLHYDALFALGCILFLITLTINITVAYISKKRKRNRLR